MESSSVYMCFPCYQEFSTLEEVLAHQLTCSAENTQLLANEAPGVEPAAATPPQVAVQSAELQSVELSSLLEQKKGTGPALDAPRVLYQCADCELLFDALSLWQEHRKTGCFLESAAGGGEPQSQEAESPAEPAPPKPPPDDSGPAAKRPRGQKKSKPPCSLLCVECGQSFSLVPELVTHRRSSHGLKEALHRCTVCGEGFLNTTLFLYHRKQHRSEADEPPRPPAVPQLSAAMLESHGEGLLLLATAGEGQLMERGLNVTPVAQLEVELEDDEGGAREECPRNEAEQVVQEGEEILVEMVEERAEAEPRGMAEEAESTGVAEEVESRGVVEEAGLTFLCHPCGCSFPSDQELSAHRRAQHGLEAALHTCTDCGDEFMNTTQFLYHRRVHRQSAGVRPAPTRPFSTASPAALAKARDADAALEPPSKLSRDWSRTPLPHECPHCGLGFTHRSRLREHVSQHTGEKLFSCNVCHKSFPSPSNLLRHTLTHGSARSHTCHACHKSFYQHTSLKRHMAVHQDGAQEAGRRGRGRGRAPANSDGSFHVCPECPASFRFEAQLKSHRLLHTSHPFPCSVCGEAFIRRKELDLHSLLHQDKEPKTCPNCSSQFLNQAALDSHLQRCSGEEVNRRTFKGQGRGKVGGQLECDMCGHRCVTQDGLDLHRLSHTGQTPLRCPLAPCRRRFASSSALGEHLVAHCCGTFGKRHAPSRYSCEFCGKEFAYPSTFAVHMRTHTNERPFECSHCGKRFRQLPHLQDHERIHSGERPFSCWVCGKSFSVAARLTEHARVHSGERPFVCPRCPTAFRSRANLDKHLRVHAADPAHPAAQSLMDDDAAVQTILLVQDSASSPAPGVQEGMLVAEEGGSSVVFLHPGLGVVAGQDVPHTIEVILEETV